MAWLLGVGLLVVGAISVSGCGEKGEPHCGDGRCDLPDETAESCPADCLDACGNGVVDADEACDGADLGEASCADFGCHAGTLACDGACALDPSGCTECGVCGDGVRDGNEQCDCGTDPWSLPSLCPAVNGDPYSVCAADCTWALRCGNQEVDSGEECDCGIDPAQLPTGCSAPNGHTGGECGADCRWQQAQCSIEILDEDCNPDLPVNACCPDEWGSPSMCLQLDPGEGLCVLECTTTAQCHYNNYCWTEVGACYPQLCGPSINGVAYYDPCAVPDGGPGVCVPVALASDDFGLCFENSDNAIFPGQPCPGFYGLVSFPRLPEYNTCLNGLCIDYRVTGDYRCLSVCDWEAVYDGAPNSDYCLQDTNCLADSVIVLEDPEDPASVGYRTADLAYCHPNLDDDALLGITTCDLINEELIADRSQTCQSRFPGTLCRSTEQVNGDTASSGLGSLIGACLDAGSATPLATWEPCGVGDVCGAGTACFPEDPFENPPVGIDRCVPLCDTADASACAPLHPEIPSGSVCLSVSVYYLPGFFPGTSADSRPSRAGLCAPPP